jgi:hypothetical protein
MLAIPKRPIFKQDIGDYAGASTETYTKRLAL